MSGYTPQLIAPFQTGLDTDLQPWLAPPDSFRVIDNLHIHHGYIQRRDGFSKFGQMQKTNNMLSISTITQANPGVVTVTSTAALMNGDTIRITKVVGMTEVNNVLYSVANITATTFELSGVDTSGFTAYGSAGQVNYLTTDRIMGIEQFIRPDNTKNLLIFDTTRAALYNGVTLQFDPLDEVDIMDGSDTDFIWADNLQPSQDSVMTNKLYFTNGKVYNGSSLNGIRTFDSSISTADTAAFLPTISTGVTLYGCKLIFSFRNRLIVLHTYEKPAGAVQTFPQRMRWCKSQNPSKWNDTINGEGSFADAATGDQIISARQLKDSIIVYFTDSVWKIVYTSNSADPFIWKKINNFRATQGKMATVGYDGHISAIGGRGITATDQNQTKRIDDRIEDFSYDVINYDQLNKTFCYRDYQNRRWWSLYSGDNSTDNNKALIFDDESSAFSTYTIDMNVMGYGTNSQDFGLDDFVAPDLDFALIDMGDQTLQDYFQANEEILLGGNITGEIFVMNNTTADKGAAITSTIESASWSPFKSQGIECQMGYIDFYVDTDKQACLSVEFFKDTDEAPYSSQLVDLLPNLNYIVSCINITQTNPASVNASSHGLTSGDIVSIYSVQGMEEVNGDNYTVTVVDENNFTLNGIDATGFTAYTTGGQVSERAFYKTQVWKRAYSGGIGFQHRIRITSTGDQDPYRIHAFKPYFRPIGTRTVN